MDTSDYRDCDFERLDCARDTAHGQPGLGNDSTTRQGMRSAENPTPTLAVRSSIPTRIAIAGFCAPCCPTWIPSDYGLCWYIAWSARRYRCSGFS